MTRTLVLKYPDNFKFPQKFNGNEKNGECKNCMFCLQIEDYLDFYCLLEEADNPACPFYLAEKPVVTDGGWNE